MGNVAKNTPTNLQKDGTTSVENSGSSKFSASDDNENIPCGNDEKSGEGMHLYVSHVIVIIMGLKRLCAFIKFRYVNVMNATDKNQYSI